jgi:hypothetical protein
MLIIIMNLFCTHACFSQPAAAKIASWACSSAETHAAMMACTAPMSDQFPTAKHRRTHDEASRGMAPVDSMTNGSKSIPRSLAHVSH